MDHRVTDDEHQHGHGDSGRDAAEWKKVAELRAVVEAQDPAAKEEDDFALRRFLRARDHNIGKASTMLLQYLAWKRVAKPRGSISDDEVRGEITKDTGSACRALTASSAPWRISTARAISLPRVSSASSSATSPMSSTKSALGCQWGGRSLRR
ncbi:hypothetical protein ACQJBY_047175 [Aegilops geniculata]